MKRLLALFFLCLMIMPISLFAAQNSQTTKTIPLDRVVAIVNDQVITETQLDKALTYAKAQIAQSKQPMPASKQLRQQVLSQLVDRDLQLQVAKRNNVSINDQELNRAIQGIAKQNKLTVSELEKQVAAQGISVKQFRKKIREEVTIVKLQREAVAPKVHVTQQEINTLMKSYRTEATARTEYNLENILISLPDTPSSKQVQAALQKAQKLVQQLRKGANFKQLAITNSNADNALKGGDLGWRTLTGMPDIFSKNIKGLKTGAVVGPIRAPNGFHILKIAGMRNPVGTTLTKAQAQEIIFQRKIQEKLQSWLQQLRQQAYVKVML